MVMPVKWFWPGKRPLVLNGNFVRNAEVCCCGGGGFTCDDFAGRPTLSSNLTANITGAGLDPFSPSYFYPNTSGTVSVSLTRNPVAGGWKYDGTGSAGNFVRDFYPSGYPNPPSFPESGWQATLEILVNCDAGTWTLNGTISGDVTIPLGALYPGLQFTASGFLPLPTSLSVSGTPIDPSAPAWPTGIIGINIS